MLAISGAPSRVLIPVVIARRRIAAW